MHFLKTTLLGGVLFLVPLVTLGLVLFKAFEVLRAVAVAVDDRFPDFTVTGTGLLDVLVVAALLLVCFVAGLFASSKAGRRFGKWLDELLLSNLPGYSIVKGKADGLRSSEETSQDFTPVMVRYDDNAQLAFEVERCSNGMVVVYTPGCPNPWSGAITYVEASRVQPVPMTVNEALKIVRTLGRGSAAYEAATD